VGSFLYLVEALSLVVLFNGDPVPCHVHCRLSDTKIRMCKVEQFQDLDSLSLLDSELLKLLARLRGTSI
jgi:hypothetical protein